MRIAVVGKGGAGKSTFSGTLARILARRGQKVVALDSDPMPGLSLSLGMGAVTARMLEEAVEKNGDRGYRLKKGIGPATAIQRYAHIGPDGVRLLSFGKVDHEGVGPLMPSMRGFAAVTARLAKEPVMSDWTIIGDLPAGPRQAAFNWAPYAETFLVVVQPTWQSILSARRIVRIVRSDPAVDVQLVINRVADADGAAMVKSNLDAPTIGQIRADQSVVNADKEGVALIDYAPSGPVVQEVAKVADALA